MVFHGWGLASPGTAKGDPFYRNCLDRSRGNPPRIQIKKSSPRGLTCPARLGIIPPYPTRHSRRKPLTMKITHLIASTFSALFCSKRGYRPFFGCDSKVVETSRYSHATDRVTQARVYMSKTANLWAGVTLTTGEVKRGDSYISFTIDGKTVNCSVKDAKAMAATLASACMKAEPKTGREMAPTEWATVADEAVQAKANAQYTASLFD